MRFEANEKEWGLEIVFDDGGMNLLSTEALVELAATIERTRVSQPRLVVFRSGRPGLFAAGADMAEMQRFGSAEAERFARLGQQVFNSIEALACATICLVDGDCFGGALDLALAFDLRWATVSSRFSHPGARLGIVTGFGGTSRWRGVVTRSAAAKLFLRNAVIEAPGAREMGLIEELVSSQSEFVRSCETIAGIPCNDLRLWKELLRHAPDRSQSDLLLLAKRLGNLYSGSR
jgi:enoyl-CoA hydratase/carnithine racemase